TPEPGVRPVTREDDAFRRSLCQCQTVGLLRNYTSQVVRRLIDEGRLPEDAWHPDDDLPGTNVVPPAHSERVARALEAHLSVSGRFRYTLDLVRGDERLDPAEDFLTNTRAGHCNRF